jgi:hypothetical protein
MITQNLYETVLITPAQQGGDHLFIVSGYASAAFTARHLEDVIEHSSNAQVRLLIGMFPQVGNLGINHPGFQRLASEDYPLRFECRYNIDTPLIHTKAYCWCKANKPFLGFLGSANYSHKGFVDNLQREAITSVNPIDLQQYFQKLWDAGLDCREPEADERVAEAIQKYRQSITNRTQQISPTSNTLSTSQIDYAGLETIDIPLVDRSGNVPSTSGLNWGQRQGRDPNQAYLSIPSPIARSNFFPNLKTPFTILTDDDRSLICVRAQPKQRGGTIGYAVQTTNNNSELGIYFRNRLGLGSGAFVQTQNLINYGRNYVSFYKVDDETYYMDFHRPIP